MPASFPVFLFLLWFPFASSSETSILPCSCQSIALKFHIGTGMHSRVPDICSQASLMLPITLAATLPTTFSLISRSQIWLLPLPPPRPQPSHLCLSNWDLCSSPDPLARISLAVPGHGYAFPFQGMHSGSIVFLWWPSFFICLSSASWSDRDWSCGDSLLLMLGRLRQLSEGQCWREPSLEYWPGFRRTEAPHILTQAYHFQRMFINIYLNIWYRVVSIIKSKIIYLII